MYPILFMAPTTLQLVLPLRVGSEGCCAAANDCRLLTVLPAAAGFVVCATSLYALAYMCGLNY